MMSSKLATLRIQPGLQLHCSKNIITQRNAHIPLALSRRQENADLVEKKIHGLPLLGALASIGLSSPAHADGGENVTSTATDTAQAAVQQLTSVPAPDDPLITVMFSIAITALSVVTLGVAYLSFASWNDSRQENEDKLRKGRKSGSPAPANAQVSLGGASEETPSRRKKDPKAARTDKGFGRK